MWMQSWLYVGWQWTKLLGYVQLRTTPDRKSKSNRLLIRIYAFYVRISLLPTDIDECTDETDNCEQTCMNTNGSFVCGCNPGYMLDGIGRNCSGTFNFTLHQIENQKSNPLFDLIYAFYVFPFPLQTLMSAQMRQTTVNKPA